MCKPASIQIFLKLFGFHDFNWSDEEFIRQMKELIGNEGDIHVTCNHSEGEQVTEAHVHAESSLVSP
ncbi:hypothetical protein K3Z73_003881 [Escherichia coli]|nr:hypothetical protein [Escherichia coli]